MCCFCVLKVGDEFLELERGGLFVSIFGNVADADTVVTGLVLFVQFGGAAWTLGEWVVLVKLGEVLVLLVCFESG